MAYSLTLSKSERDAFDWVGHRYQTGSEVAYQIIHYSPEGTRWDEDGEITFNLPEHAAWHIAMLSVQEEGLWPCFSDELKQKMVEFCDKII
jgi:hypothetical protein